MPRHRKPDNCPEDYVWRRRNGEWILVHKQVVRWQARRRRVEAAANKKFVEDKLCGRQIELDAPVADVRDILDKKLFS